MSKIVTLLVNVKGQAESVELRLNGSRVIMDPIGQARVKLDQGHHVFQYLGRGKPGKKIALKLQPENGEGVWVREFRIPADGVVVGSKKFRMASKDDWGGPRLSIR